MVIDGITLTGSYEWENEFSYSEVEQNQDRSVTGAFLVQEQLKQYGREIDLIGGQDAAWVTRAVLLSLKAKEAMLGHAFNATLPDGRTFRCMFNRGAGEAITARNLTRYQGTPTNDTLYYIDKIRLITVEP